MLRAFTCTLPIILQGVQQLMRNHSDLAEPTLKMVHDQNTSYDAEENVISVGVSEARTLQSQGLQHETNP